MILECEQASASEAGDEIFQVLFEASPDEEEGPYVLIQRAWLEEDDGEGVLIYIETQDHRLCGHYENPKAELLHNRLTLELPPPANETIEIHFTKPDRSLREIRRMLEIIFQRKFGA